MGIGDILLDPDYIPKEEEYVPELFYFRKNKLKCPVSFTEDPIEYAQDFLKAKLLPIQKQILEDLFLKYDEKNKPLHTTAVLILGMRSGKSFTSAIVGSFLLQKLLAMEDPAAHFGLFSKSKLTGEYIGNSEDQSKRTAYAHFVSIVQESPWWKKYTQWLLDRELEEGNGSLFQKQEKKIAFLEKNVEVLSLHSNSASLAGMTAFYCGFDELSRFDVSEGAVQEQSEKRTAQAVYFTASRATASISPFSRTLITTSPMFETDFGMQLLCMCGKVYSEANRSYIETLREKIPERVDRMVGYHFTTFEVNLKSETNPGGVDPDTLEEQRKLSPATFNRDYNAIPQAGVAPFFDLPERIEMCVNATRSPVASFEDKIIEETVGYETRKYIGKNVIPLHADKMKKYFICCDQGEVKDSYVLAMGHGDEVDIKVQSPNGSFQTIKRYKAIIDLIGQWKPNPDERTTVSFRNVEDVIRILNLHFYVERVVYDSWQSSESIERLFSEGIRTQKMGATLDMYETLKLLFYSNMVEIPKNDRLILELRQLNNIKNRKVDHPNGGSKDIADAVVRTVHCIYEDSLKDAIQGRFMLPITQQLPTQRSIITAYNAMVQGDMYGYNVFDSAPFAGGNVFGKDTTIVPNVPMFKIPTTK